MSRLDTVILSDSSPFRRYYLRYKFRREYALLHEKPVAANAHPSMAFQTDLPFFTRLGPDEMERFVHVFRPTGYIYSVFGALIHGIPDLERYKVLLIVRDPRDVLISKYFSLAFSHPPLATRANEQRLVPAEHV